VLHLWSRFIILVIILWERKKVERILFGRRKKNHMRGGGEISLNPIRKCRNFTVTAYIQSG